MSQDKTLASASLADPHHPPGSSRGELNLGALEANPGALVNTYADSLITSLFEEVDKLLEGDSETLERVSASLALTAASPEPLSPPEPAPITTATPESATALADGGDALAVLATEAEAQALAITLAPQPGRTNLGRLLDRLLLLSTGLSLMGLAAVLWINHRQPVTVPNGAGEAANAEFLQYLQRSLQVIDKKAQLASQPPAPPHQTDGQPPSLALLPLPPSTGSSAIGGPINVIERVYIPYQTTQPITPQPTVPVTPPQAPADRAQAPSPTPAMSHRLVGVLELGDRSAALFEVNGVPQRVYIGERIGTAGWTLVSVAHQEVMIRRNGDVRSLYIGQQF
ncbi:MAG: type II secretion system protein N [Cyanobacteriota bacterium]|nr:type II secretion system protein N [Cyanobacteriota bacterium]